MSILYPGVGPPFTDGVTTNEVNTLIDAAIAILTPTNVREYGAIGNGIADDTAAIQAVLDANKEALFPPGTYSISSLMLPNGCVLRGVKGARFVARTAGQRMLTTGTDGTLKTGITISGLEIDANSLAGTQGIYLNAAQEFLLEDLYIHNCGNVSSLAANSTADNGLGGFGIYVESRYGSSPSSDGIIRNCQIESIAGRGNYSGDGITIASYSSSSAVRTTNILVEGCTISVCGRHAAALSGGEGDTIPLNVRFVNCLFEKAALSGLDIEDGEDCVVSKCSFLFCGNDQTYYNPAVVYGSTYNLIAGIATSNGDYGGKFLRVEHSSFQSCYVDISYGAAYGISLLGCIFESSINLKVGLAQGTNRLSVEDCKFSGSAQYYCMAAELVSIKNSVLQDFTANTKNLIIEGCVVQGVFNLSNCTDSRVVNAIVAGTPTFTATVNLELIHCTFSTVSLAQSSTTANLKFVGCTFDGGGAAANGLSIGYQSVNGLSVIECFFDNYTSHAIATVNAGLNRIYQISGCLFTNCGGNGIYFFQGLASGYQILNNTFKSIAGHCFEHALTGTETQANALIVGNRGQATGWGVIASLSGSGSISNWSALGNEFSQCSAGQISYTGYSAPLFSVPNLDASKITSGQFTEDRLPIRSGSSQVLTASSTISVTAGVRDQVIGISSASNITLTSVPTIQVSGVTANQLIVLVNTGSFSITLQSGTSLSGSKLNTDQNVTINAGRSTTLMYSSALSAWVQILSRGALALGTLSLQDASTVSITGGSIDGTAIGANTPSTVKTTALTATGTSHSFGGNSNASTLVSFNGASSGNKLLLFQSGGLNNSPDSFLGC